MGTTLSTFQLPIPALAFQLCPPPVSPMVRPLPTAERPLQSRRLNLRSLNTQLQFSLPFCLRSACRAQSTHALRTHALPPEIPGLRVDSSPEASSCPLPQISSTRLGSGPRRHTLRASMYRIQRTNFKKGASNHVQQNHPHRPSRKECRSQNRAEQEGLRRPQHCHQRELEEREGRVRNPHRMAPHIRLG